MRMMTAQCLRNAFAEESMSHMRYLIFSDQAGDENFPNTARLFRAVAYADRVLASNHYRIVNEMLGDHPVCLTVPFIYERTVDNLEKSIIYKKILAEQVYPAYLSVSRADRENGAEKNFIQAIEAVLKHMRLLKCSYDTIIRTAGEPAVSVYHVCTGCGDIEMAAPPQCGICGIPGDKFHRID